MRNVAHPSVLRTVAYLSFALIKRRSGANSCCQTDDDDTCAIRLHAGGDPRLDPYSIVTTTLARDGTLTIPPVRFVCRPDVSAFEGTESVKVLAPTE